MRIVVYYRKSLKMTEGKLASQIGHVTKELGRMIPSTAKDDIIIVLGVSDTKYRQLTKEYQKENIYWHEQVDNGLTEIVKGTSTAFGYIAI